MFSDVFYLPTRYNINRTVQAQNTDRGVKNSDSESRGFALCSENKGDDQLIWVVLCFLHMQKAGFLMTRLI